MHLGIGNSGVHKVQMVVVVEVSQQEYNVEENKESDEGSVYLVKKDQIIKG